MGYKERIHSHIIAASQELFEYIREQDSKYPERWVPGAVIKRELELNMASVPQAAEKQGEKGWLFTILARILEDKNLTEYRNSGGRAYYRTRN